MSLLTYRHRARGPLSARTAATVLAASVGMYLLYRIRAAPKSVDLAVYRATGAAVRHGHAVYGNLHLHDGLKATYSPFSALLFTPLSLMSLAWLRYVVLSLNVALLVTISISTCRLLAVPPHRRLPIALMTAAAGIASEPVVATLNLGQIDLAIVALVIADLTLGERARLRGVGIGLATAIKLTPGLFVVYLLLTRRYRESAVAVTTFATVTGLSWLLLPGASHTYWTHLVFDVRRVGLVARPDNQSIRGLLARFAQATDAAPVATALIAVIGIAAMAIACLAYQRLGEAWGAIACAFTALLVSPISWTHHWVWCVPAALLLWVHARRCSIAAIVFWTYVVLLPHNRYTSIVRYEPWLTLASGAYAYFGIFLLALTAHRALRHPAPHDTPPRS